MLDDVALYIMPREVWDFYEANEKKLRSEMCLIAENTTTERRVFLTACALDDGPQLQVTLGDKPAFYSEDPVSASDAAMTFREFLDTFLDLDRETLEEAERLMRIPEDQDEPEEQDEPRDPDDDLMDIIYEREDQLSLAFQDFLLAVDETSDGLLSVEEQGELLDIFLASLSDYGVSVWRPTFTVNEETGEEEIINYPYETITLVYDDDDEEEDSDEVDESDPD